MWEQSMQVEALRILSEWWGSSRRHRTPRGLRQAAGAPGATVADALALPPGYRPTHLDERLAEVS